MNTDKQYMLIYGIEGDRRDILERVAFGRGFGIRPIEDHELDLRVHQLLDGQVNERPENFKQEHDLGDDFEYILFVNIKDKALYAFLDELKDNDVYIPHKAILTETNLKWPLYFLMEENKEEHRVMTLYGQLRNVMRMATSLADDTKDHELIDLLDEAQHFFEPREFEFDELRDIYNRLATRVNEIIQERRNSEQE